MLFTDDNLGLWPERGGTDARPLGKAYLVPHGRFR
ncbi:hypothetical protein SGL43_01882 [Streptomyces globisporus]|uniref:Uncharacterized protein n=1 Tax=Streptomyces globisporus TaxID=1908 RepID=A0ABM9GTS2_STRGL|nr:hypothetical protein A3Q37_06902 [Streptomyces sp. PTY087I2]RDL03192.1 hypothetical protein DER30_4756 [Streptomyces sp. HB202]CAH9414870.1 hypothetical protein SGL43_01882 [Streptomyces globisporus]SBU89583.1 hypothetical protein YW5DRAFT_00653 [Streptomyces sp. Ncost-T6T-1]SCD98613.1 hypothetical protein GA0115253_102592 [Streptomyces sp. Termitarium-T10T-6]SCF73776.1 hypothetical protein GA0115280_1096177 [Streptomyces sp. Cmuel-A718b]SNB85320.1 hypothetical protein SAMN02745831_02500 [